MAPRVVHCKREPYDVYIGRPSRWGNPFSHQSGTLAKFRVSSREEAIARYAEWIRKQPALVAAAKRELCGKVLGCWCAPLPCHGDVLLELANESSFELDARSALSAVPGVDAAFISGEGDERRIIVAAREHGIVDRSRLLEIEHQLVEQHGHVEVCVRAHQGRGLAAYTGLRRLL